MRFIFLLYVSRSGSTAFARQIAAHCPDVMVMPEFRLPEYLFAEGDAYIKSLPVEKLLHLMKKDHQLPNLEISDRSIADIAMRSQGKGIRYILSEISRSFAEMHEWTPKAVIIKNGSILPFYKNCVNAVPDASFIHIYRDVRGVANSMMKTRNIYFQNEPMGRGDMVYIAKVWSHYLKTIKKIICSGRSICEVRYESLCLHTVEVIRDVAGELGLTFKAATSDEHSIAFAIGTAEQGIHLLVSKTPTGSRVEAWKEELRSRDGLVLELVSEETMRLYDYNRWYDDTSLRKYLLLTQAFLHHIAVELRYLMLRSIHLARKRSFALRLRLYIRRLLAGWYK